MTRATPLLAAVAATAVLGTGAPADTEPRYFDASLAFDGELLGHAFVDLDGGAPELVVALLGEDGRRRLQVLALGPRGYDPRPVHEVEVLEDVTAYGFADVRDEPGPELLLFTRSGVFSYALAKRGYRGNAERLVEAPLLFDVPNPRALPHWPYRLGREGARELVLVPERAGLSVHGPRRTEAEGAGAPAYERRTTFEPLEVPPAALRGAAARRRGDEEGDGAEVTFGPRSASPLLAEPDASGVLLSDRAGYAAPALVDANGDGAPDLVLLTEEGLRVHLWRADGYRGEPDRVEPFPDHLAPRGEDESLSLRLADLDGDGDQDLVAIRERAGDGFENADLTLLLLLNDGRRFLAPSPDQVLRLRAATVRVSVVDVNRDRRPDLVVRLFELPSLVESVTGLEFTLTHLVFLGEDARGRVVARSPVLKQSRTFDEEGVGEAIKFRDLSHDCDGDGRPDLVELDLQGRIAIRRLVFRSSFFGGDTWALEEEPWKRFDVRAELGTLEVLDLDGDGLGDVLGSTERGLTMLLSGGGRR